MRGGDQEMLRVVELWAVILTLCGGPVTAAATDEAIIIILVHIARATTLVITGTTDSH